MKKFFDEDQFRMNQVNGSELLQTCRERALLEEIPDNIQKFPVLQEADLAERRRKKRHIRAYCSQVLNYMMDRAYECHCAYVFFDEEGCLIRLKATEQVEKWLEAKKIVLGSVWDFESIGPNAVTVGLRENTTLVSIGKSNYQKILSDMAIYFSPLTIMEDGTVLRFGGIGILVPVEEASQAYLQIATCMASCLMIRVSMAWRTSASFDAGSKGMVMLDINTKNDAVTITHHNENFFDIFGLQRIPRRDVYFKPAEEYFDPLPNNKKFWNIVRNLEEVHDYELMLQIRGKLFDCIISTEPNRQEDWNSKGILLYITTKQQISKQISEKTSNNAILSFDNIIGKSAAIKSAIQKAKLLAGTDSNIMLLGESGVGKDIFAQAIHNRSKRRDKPFVAVNCGALPRDLIASELFGYDGGAFTGAKKQGNIGKFELANGGTLFLDEIGELPLDLQATLLRAVEQKQFMRLGSNKMIKVDVKIIAATNADIPQMIDERRFRADLYYRLGTMRLYIPPLRERDGDSVLLMKHFMRNIANRIGRNDEIVLSPDAEECLLSCPWKGNVRELQNLADCIVQLYPDSVITAAHIQENLSPEYFAFQKTMPEPAEQKEPVSVVHRRSQLTAEDILDALDKCGQNRSEAAKYLGISRRTIYRYMEKMGIE